jgi:DNA-binding LacI/PurR family transcriptional regulator
MAVGEQLGLGRGTLHERLAQQLQNGLLAAAVPGTRLPGMHALAAEAGVSVNTMRAALILLQQQGQIEIRHGSGCYVQEPPTDDREFAVLVDVDILCPRASWFFTGAAKAARLLLAERGLAVRLYLGSTDTDQPAGLSCVEFLRDVAADRIAGVIALATLPFADWLQPLRDRGVPAVGMTGGGFDVEVRVDLPGIVESATALLAEHGRRRLGLIGWGGTRAGSGPADAYRDFAGCCARHGLQTRPEWVCADLSPRQSGAGWEAFREVWAATQEKPDGLVVCDDILFADAAIAMLELGLHVPADLEIVVETNRGSDRRWPFPVSRIEVDPAAGAAVMVDELLRLHAGGAGRSRPLALGYEVLSRPAVEAVAR